MSSSSKILKNLPKPPISLKNMHYYTNFMLNIEKYYYFKLSSSTMPEKGRVFWKNKQGRLRPIVHSKVDVKAKYIWCNILR